jgi:hypothetical protein
MRLVSGFRAPLAQHIVAKKRLRVYGVPEAVNLVQDSQRTLPGNH